MFKALINLSFPPLLVLNVSELERLPQVCRSFTNLTFNCRRQIITELLGHCFFVKWPMQSLLIHSFSVQILMIYTLFWPMFAVSAMAD